MVLQFTAFNCEERTIKDEIDHFVLANLAHNIPLYNLDSCTCLSGCLGPTEFNLKGKEGDHSHNGPHT